MGEDSNKISSGPQVAELPVIAPEHVRNTNPMRGLSSIEVEQQVAAGRVNTDDSGKTKTIKQIVLGNVLTLFNLINLVLAVGLLLVGSIKNASFMIIIIANVCIGIFQEIRSKKTMDRLSILSASKVNVVRDSKEIEITPEEIVQGDVMILRAGNQIQADGVILRGSVQVDESFITGEADAIAKEPGDKVMAGSFMISGKCRVQATAVGREKYVSTISQDAKRMKKINSEIMKSLNWIVRIVSVIIVPLGITIFVKQLNLDGATVKTAVESTTASLISMIPEGLMLLTSTALAVSVIRLSSHKVMIQQLYCIETLARVDTLCLDKTGTLTEGCMEVVDTVYLDPKYQQLLPKALLAMTEASGDLNATSRAIKERYEGIVSAELSATEWKCTKEVPFSSKTKWSGATFEQQGTYCMGAAEFLYPSMSEELRTQIAENATRFRVILVVHSDAPFNDKQLPAPELLTPVGLILLRDRVRKEAAPTLAYFAEQGVTIKVISGDSPDTVAGIARYAGVADWERAIDLSTLTSDEEVAAAANEYTVFGRVTPRQKKLLVSSMKAAGHTVAMTGDGVNDVMALKEADCSIAMASGTDAARNASELVLLESNFDALPLVVAEGRRCINNVQRSSALFLTKTFYAGLLAFLFLFINTAYPFIPVQMSLLSATCIGVPAFFLAMQPNHDRVKGHFLRNVFLKAFPGGLSVAINIGFILFCASKIGMTKDEVSTLCIIVAGFTGMLTLYRISKPFNWLRVLIMVLVNIALWGVIIWCGDFFQLCSMTTEMLVYITLFLSAAYGLLSFTYRIFEEGIPRVRAIIQQTKEDLARRKAAREDRKRRKREAKEQKKAAKEAARAERRNKHKKKS